MKMFEDGHMDREREKKSKKSVMTEKRGAYRVTSYNHLLL